MMTGTAASSSIAVPTGRRSQPGASFGQKEGDAEGDRYGDDHRQQRR